MQTDNPKFSAGQPGGNPPNQTPHRSLDKASAALARQQAPASPLDHSPLRGKPAFVQLLAITTVLMLVMVVELICFTYPAANSAADGVQIGITGPKELVAQVTEKLETGLDGRATLVARDSREQLVSGIKDRSLQGGIVLDQAAPEVLTATAGGQAVAGIGTNLAAQLQKNLDVAAFTGLTSNVSQALAELPAKIKAQVQQVMQAQAQAQAAQPGQATPGAVGQENQPGQAPQFGPPPELMAKLQEAQLPVVTLTDVVPLSAKDANGIGITLAAIPLTIAGLVGGIVVSLLAMTRLRRLAGAGLYAGLYAAAAALVLHNWLGIYPGNYWVVFGVMALSVLATCTLFTGLYAVMKKGGLLLAIVITIFMGLPLAAFAMPYSFLPHGLGTFGQFLIPGATGTLARNVAYFPQADITAPLTVLLVWALVGALLTLVPSKAASSHVPAASSPTL